MNWKLVIQLSIFGLLMALATVFVVPSNAEPFFWLPIFLITAYLIAKQAPGRYFLHGLALGLVNCFWVTAAHILLFNRYIATHPQEAAMMTRMPMPDAPRVMMAMMGPVIGLVSGCVIGLFAFLTHKLLSGRATRGAATR